MTRRIAAVVAVAALLLSLDVGVAQQPSMVRIAATTVNDLRAWDGYVTAALRSGDLRALSVEQDPSLPARRVERLQQYYQGVPIFGAAGRSRFGRRRGAIHLWRGAADVHARHTPGTDCGGGRAGDHRPGGDSARLLRRIELTILPMAGSEPRLAYTTVVSSSRAVFRLFIDANTGAELLRFSELQTQSAVGTGRGLVGDTKKMSVRPQGAAFVADDRLRPPVVDDLRHAEQSGPHAERAGRLRSAVRVGPGHGHRQHLDGHSGDRRPCLHRVDVRLLLQASRTREAWTIAIVRSSR